MGLFERYDAILTEHETETGTVVSTFWYCSVYLLVLQCMPSGTVVVTVWYCSGYRVVL